MMSETDPEIVAYLRKEHNHDGTFVSKPKEHVFRIGDEPLIKLSDAKAMVEAEREACARVAEERLPERYFIQHGIKRGMSEAEQFIAIAIRNRLPKPNPNREQR